MTTLHVLFPPPMLLQALDLLDRGLVLRVIEKEPTSPEDLKMHFQEEGEAQPVNHPPQANIHLRSSPPLPGPPDSGREGGNRKGKKNSVYQVRSSQLPKSRDSGAGAAIGSMVYSVRLGAWNCSCAAFAFSAFPGTFSTTAQAPWNLSGRQDDELRELRVRGNEMGRKREGEGEDWEFGGLSFDGKKDGGVPVCKHLVACLLGERWDVLQGYVREREVSREEMSGIGAEG